MYRCIACDAPADTECKCQQTDEPKKFIGSGEDADVALEMLETA